LLFIGDEVVEWNGRCLQRATFEEVHDIILESKQEPQVELIVHRSVRYSYWTEQDIPEILLFQFRWISMKFWVQDIGTKSCRLSWFLFNFLFKWNLKMIQMFYVLPITFIFLFKWLKFEITNSCKLVKDKSETINQLAKKKKIKITNTDPRNTTQKIKDWAMQN